MKGQQHNLAIMAVIAVVIAFVWLLTQISFVSKVKTNIGGGENATFFIKTCERMEGAFRCDLEDIKSEASLLESCKRLYAFGEADKGTEIDKCFKGCLDAGYCKSTGGRDGELAGDIKDSLKPPT